MAVTIDLSTPKFNFNHVFRDTIDFFYFYYLHTRHRCIVVRFTLILNLLSVYNARYYNIMSHNLTSNRFIPVTVINFLHW